MVEELSKHDPKRQGSRTGMLEGLANEEDAAVLGVDDNDMQTNARLCPLSSNKRLNS